MLGKCSGSRGASLACAISIAGFGSLCLEHLSFLGLLPAVKAPSLKCSSGHTALVKAGSAHNCDARGACLCCNVK